VTDEETTFRIELHAQPPYGWAATVRVPQEWYDARCGGMVGLQGGAETYPPFLRCSGRIASEALEALEAAYGRCAMAYQAWTQAALMPGAPGYREPTSA